MDFIQKVKNFQMVKFCQKVQLHKKFVRLKAKTFIRLFAKVILS